LREIEGLALPKLLSAIFGLVALNLLAACSDEPWNNPHPPQPEDKIVYQSFVTPVPPKHLDPAISYASDESIFIMQIYEPPMGYHFLKRPYELIPQGMSHMPEVVFLDESGVPMAEGEGDIAFTRYTLQVREDAQYQPHPAFALSALGEPLYLFEDAASGALYPQIPDFPEMGSRSVTASDYAYSIKRMADPELGSPLLGLMSRYIVGLQEYSQQLAALPREGWLNLDDYAMSGVEVLDDHRLAITIKGRYPQFKFWLAMSFFAPVPIEVDRFYHNPGFAERNLTLDWWPVGSGPFMIVKNDPNSEIILERNPNYREDYYPSEGAPGDAEAGLLADAGKRLPLIDRAVFRLEKEVLSLWTKFLQGYYDRSGEGHSNTTGFFDQAFVVGPDGLEMSEDIADHGISMSPDVKPAIYYYGFNMRDPVVGGYTEDKRKLRQALQIAHNTEEYLAIFYKGNGIAGQTLIPPGVPGHVEGEAGINPYVYDWVDGEPKRKSIEYAKQLMAEAGYPGGRDAVTGEPLKIFIDVQSHAIGNSGMKWIERAMEPLGVQVEFRPADWNRTREKLVTGNNQIFSMGWLADYPDPENFLFLLNSPESPLVCECDGSNYANYESPEYDALFNRMRTLPQGPEREALVARMVELFRRDAVWLNVYFPKEVYLNNSWVYNTKRHGISKATLKYLRLDVAEREQKQALWNQPVTWPLYVAAVLLLALLWPGVMAYRRRQKATVR
jgi:oligopeptide transport system substrate-binding protein